MTAINFPDSPSNGDTHTVGGVTYTYNSTETKWKTTINSNAFLPLSGGTVSGNILMGGEIQHDGDTDTNISFDTDTILFDTAGSERFRVGSAGQLGIGGATYGTSGQFLQSQGASAAPQWATPSADATYGTYTAFNTGSGFLRVTGLNTNTKKTTILVVNWSPASSVNGFLNLGTSSGIEGTGYQGTGWYQNAAAKSYVNQASYFVLPIGNSNHALNGRIIITEIDPTNHSYLAEAYLGDTNTGLMCGFSGTKQLSGKFERFDLGWLSGNIDGGAYTVVQEV